MVGLPASRVWPRQAANQESSGASRPSALRGLARCQARPRAARSTRGPSRSLQTCRRDAGARQVMATDGNRLVCGIQRTRCAAPHTRCTLAGAGARDLAHPLLMSRKAIADDRQETRDRPNPRSARPRRWTLWSAWESFLECDWFRTSTAEPVRSGSRRNATVCLLDLSGR